MNKFLMIPGWTSGDGGGMIEKDVCEGNRGQLACSRGLSLRGPKLSCYMVFDKDACAFVSSLFLCLPATTQPLVQCYQHSVATLTNLQSTKLYVREGTPLITLRYRRFTYKPRLDHPLRHSGTAMPCLQIFMYPESASVLRGSPLTIR